MKRVLVAAVMLVSAVVQANDGLYVGANLVRVDYKEEGFQTASPTALAFRVGKDITPNLAIEGRLGTGVSDDTIRVSNINVAVEVENFYGVYARGIIPIQRVALYGLIGYTHGEIAGSANGIAIRADDGDFSYGVGGDITVFKGGAVNVEMARLFSGTDYDVNTLSVGFKYSLP